MLGVFAFLAVASSHFLIGKQYLYPPMLVAAFVVCVGFDSVQEAVAATVVKTVGIGGGILVGMSDQRAGQERAGQPRRASTRRV